MVIKIHAQSKQQGIRIDEESNHRFTDACKESASPTLMLEGRTAEEITTGIGRFLQVRKNAIEAGEAHPNHTAIIEAVANGLLPTNMREDAIPKVFPALVDVRERLRKAVYIVEKVERFSEAFAEISLCVEKKLEKTCQRFEPFDVFSDSCKEDISEERLTQMMRISGKVVEAFVRYFEKNADKSCLNCGEDSHRTCLAMADSVVRAEVVDAGAVRDTLDSLGERLWLEARELRRDPSLSAATSRKADGYERISTWAMKAVAELRGTPPSLRATELNFRLLFDIPFRDAVSQNRQLLIPSIAIGAVNTKPSKAHLAVATGVCSFGGAVAYGLSTPIALPVMKAVCDGGMATLCGALGPSATLAAATALPVIGAVGLAYQAVQLYHDWRLATEFADRPAIFFLEPLEKKALRDEWLQLYGISESSLSTRDLGESLYVNINFLYYNYQKLANANNRVIRRKEASHLGSLARVAGRCIFRKKLETTPFGLLVDGYYLQDTGTLAVAQKIAAVWRRQVALSIRFLIEETDHLFS